MSLKISSLFLQKASVSSLDIIEQNTIINNNITFLTSNSQQLKLDSDLVVINNTADFSFFELPPLIQESTIIQFYLNDINTKFFLIDKKNDKILINSFYGESCQLLCYNGNWTVLNY